MRAPTPAQRAILELLTEFAYLTTAQIWEYLPTATNEQARRNRLARLQRQGWIAAAPLHPEQGAASPRYWTLTPAGAEALGVPYTSPTISHAPTIRRSLDRAATDPARVGSQQARILAALAEWKQLTTPQLWRYLTPEQPRAFTQKRLWLLQQRHLIRGVPTQPQQGGVSDYYWMLLEAGANALGIPYHQQYRRRPSLTTLEHRGLLLAVLSAGAQAGWSMLRPATNTEAARQVEQHLIAAVLARGGQRLPEPGRVGAIVPNTIPDWVATVPGQSARTILLIPHPPSATRAFWRHQENTKGAARRRPMRLALYARLAAWLPVVGVFSSASVGQSYAPLLRGAGFGWVAVDDLTALLTRFGVDGTLPNP
jgi:hypothetical protein